MSPKSDQRLALVLLTILAGLLVHGFRQARSPQPGEPPGMPPGGADVDLRFDLPTPWQRALTPVATRWEEPLGSEHGAFTYNPQPFWAMNDARGGHHTGDDLNGIGGMNSDFGDPVRSTADGLVTFAGIGGPGWGNIVMVAHRNPDGSFLQSMYAHLSVIQVHPGDLIARGEPVGEVGTADGLYPAHLHFEIRDGDASERMRGYADQPLHHRNPLETIHQRNPAPADDLSPSPLVVIRRDALTGTNADANAATPPGAGH